MTVPAIHQHMLAQKRKLRELVIEADLFGPAIDAMAGAAPVAELPLVRIILPMATRAGG